MERRTFIKTTSGAMAILLTPSGIIHSGIISGSASENSFTDKCFLNPPDDARPWVYWFWINGNITKEGITADLEAMQRVGIGGVLIMEVDGSPQGPVAFGTENWKEMFRFSCVEANRLGLEINMNDGAGWTGSGGPWNTPENSMQHVFHTEITLDGGKTFNNVLPQPGLKEVESEDSSVSNSKNEQAVYYLDIAIIAFPTPINNDYRNDNIEFKAGFKAGSTPPFMKKGDAGRFLVLPVNMVHILSAMESCNILNPDRFSGN